MLPAIIGIALQVFLDRLAVWHPQACWQSRHAVRWKARKAGVLTVHCGCLRALMRPVLLCCITYRMGTVLCMYYQWWTLTRYRLHAPEAYGTAPVWRRRQALGDAVASECACVQYRSRAPGLALEL